MLFDLARPSQCLRRSLPQSLLHTCIVPWCHTLHVHYTGYRGGWPMPLVSMNQHPLPHGQELLCLRVDPVPGTGIAAERTLGLEMQTCHQEGWRIEACDHTQSLRAIPGTHDPGQGATCVCVRNSPDCLHLRNIRERLKNVHGWINLMTAVGISWYKHVVSR